MNKLKTLEEIIIKARFGKVEVVFPEELRKEAIAWIKELEQEHKASSDGSMTYISYIHPKYEGKIEWIKHFFNIEEKELK